MNFRSIKGPILAFSLSLLVACGNTSMREFERMNSAELMAYNRTVQYMEQVHCADEIRTGSHIRRRHCETLQEIVERLARSASEINILGTAQIY